MRFSVSRLMLAVFALMALAAAPALADDQDCVGAADAMHAETSSCKVAGNDTYGYYRVDCLLQYKREIAQVATLCINAAQAHYDASNGLQGYDANRELVMAATLEGIAGSANEFQGNCGLAISQLDSIVTLLTSVVHDPYVGDLAGPARKELSLAKILLSESKHYGC